MWEKRDQVAIWTDASLFAAERLTGEMRMIITEFKSRPFKALCVRTSSSPAHRSWLRFILQYWQLLRCGSMFIEVCACGYTIKVCLTCG
jgi:hypothetical protein